MPRLSRSRLAAAASALAASFAVVLAIGAFAGGSHHVTTRSVTLTVSATTARHNPIRGRPVSVLRMPSLTQAVSGDLNVDGQLKVSVAKGTYLVCVSTSGGWRVAYPAVIRLPGWACRSRGLQPGRPASVTFTLTPAATRTLVGSQ